MIRILQVLGGLDTGGAETMVMNLYRAVDRSQIQFDFIIHTDEKQAYYDEILALGGKIFAFPRFRGYNVLDVRKAWDKFFAEHPEYKILHSHVRSYASIYLPIAKKHGVKTIIHSHSTSNGKGIESIVKYLLQKPLRHQADYFFGCSKEAGQWLFGEEIVNSDRYFMLQNAIDCDIFKRNEQTRKDYRKTLDIEGKKVYIHVGRLCEAKNHCFLLEVFSEIQKREENSALLIVGDGELRESIEQKIKQLGLEDSVKMLGARRDICNILQAADCFLFPSLWEGLPVTVVEAQAASLPCFISDTVTDDVCVSDLVKKLPIDRGAKLWADMVISGDLTKKDVQAEVKKAGFDTKETAKWLSKFYEGII